MHRPELRTVRITRYVTPLREGGSLPGITEADDGFMYVLKFRGAGQGTRALVAELIGGELARAAGMNVPEIVLAHLEAEIGRGEGDEEIRDLLKASVGVNLGLHYLSGAITYDPAVTTVDAQLASRIVWLDAFLTNVDRTAKNTNMLTWRQQLWLIDHGASLYFHHTWHDWEAQSQKPFVQVKDHVLLPAAAHMDEANEYMLRTLSPELIRATVDLVPDTWLNDGLNENAAAARDVYTTFLINRLHHSGIFVNEAKHARERSV